MLADPGQLRLLALIERHGSLSAAAQALGLTPAAVTQQVARAERDWQAPLVRRGPRGATLTAAGALLAAHGRAIDAETHRAAADLAALLGQLSLRLRIGAFQAAALHLLPPALTALRHRHPDADLSIIDITSDRGVPAVAAGELDLTLIASWDAPPTAPEHVRIRRLLDDPMVLVLPDDHPLATQQQHQAAIPLGHLRDEAWVTIRAGHAARAQFDHAAATAGFTPKIRFETESYDVAQALVATGIGIALVSRLALTHLRGTTHRALTPSGQRDQLHRQLHTVAPADTTLTPLVAVFLQLLHDVATDITTRYHQTRVAGGSYPG
jgi:molybdate transport repressor ModE-like protein